MHQQGSGDSHSSEELPSHRGYRGLRRCSSGSEEGAQDMCEEGVRPEADALSPAPGTGAHVEGMWRSVCEAPLL